MAEDDPMGDEPRDEALARALDVAPLDELTRRRLVGAAIAAREETTITPAIDAPPVPRGNRRARILGIAAAAVAFVVLGVAALALPRDDTTQVAGRPTEASGPLAAADASAAPSAPDAGTSSRTAQDGGTAASAAPSGASEQVTAALPDLGRLGDLSAAGSRERVVAAAEPAVEGTTPQRWAFTFQTCPPRTLTVVATGLGSIGGDPVFVTVARRDDGTLRVRAIDGTTCELRPLP